MPAFVVFCGVTENRRRDKSIRFSMKIKNLDIKDGRTEPADCKSLLSSGPRSCREVAEKRFNSRTILVGTRTYIWFQYSYFIYHS
jgi:hypothetical protein